jgi:type I restriction enzyme S subunit
LLVPCSTTTTGIDLADVTALCEENVLLGGDITILRFKESGVSEFFAYYLTHYKKHDLAKYGQGSTIVHLYYNHFKDMIINYPHSKEEQQKISNLLTTFDKKIENIQTQIEESKAFKKGLLQQMFV